MFLGYCSNLKLVYTFSNKHFLGLVDNLISESKESKVSKDSNGAKRKRDYFKLFMNDPNKNPTSEIF